MAQTEIKWKHGMVVDCTIDNRRCLAKVNIDKYGQIYLCQNIADGLGCSVYPQYKYSWYIEKGDDCSLGALAVKILKIKRSGVKTCPYCKAKVKIKY